MELVLPVALAVFLPLAMFRQACRKHRALLFVAASANERASVRASCA